MEERVVDMGDADQRHRRAVGQGDRRVVVMLIGRRHNVVDRPRLIFALESDPVAMHRIEADDGVVAGDSVVLDQRGPGPDLNRIVAAAAVDGFMPAAADDQIVAAAAGDLLAAAAPINRIGAAATLDGITAAAIDQVGAAAAADHVVAAAVDRIGAGATLDRIVAAAVNHVGAAAAADQVAGLPMASERVGAARVAVPMVSERVGAARVAMPGTSERVGAARVAISTTFVPVGAARVAISTTSERVGAARVAISTTFVPVGAARVAIPTTFELVEVARVAMPGTCEPVGAARVAMPGTCEPVGAARVAMPRTCEPVGAARVAMPGTCEPVGAARVAMPGTPEPVGAARVAIPAIYRGGSATGGDRIAASAGIDHVPAAATKDRVVSGPCGDRIGSVADYSDPIIALRQSDGFAAGRLQSHTLVTRIHTRRVTRPGHELEVEVAMNWRWKVGPIRCGDDIDRLSRRKERVLPTWNRCHLPLPSNAVAVSTAREPRRRWFRERHQPRVPRSFSRAISLLCAAITREEKDLLYHDLSMFLDALICRYCFILGFTDIADQPVCSSVRTARRSATASYLNI